MTASAWIALAFGALGLVMNLVALGIGFGVMKGTIKALGDRVTTLECELTAMSDLKVTVAEVKTTVGFMHEQLKELNASIRWMRASVAYEPRPPRGVTRTK